MNPLWLTVVSTVAHLTRVCPKCGHRQIVSTKKKHEKVICRRCQSDIPPKTE